jgi:hypothetical protein
LAIYSRAAARAWRIGTHISDKADSALIAELDAFVKPLCELHRPGGSEVELARGLLLQSRGDKRRRRRPPDLLALDFTDCKRGRFAGCDNRARLGLGELVRLIVDALVFVAVEPGLERRRIAGLQTGVERPVLLGAECLPLDLALDDYPQRHRLHPAGADPALDLIPEQRA